MKRVVSSSYVRKHPTIKRVNQLIRSKENDLSYLDDCYTLEDVKNHEYEAFNVTRLIRELETNTDEDPREIIEYWIDRFDGNLTIQQKEYRRAYSNLENFYKYVNQLSGVIDIELVDGKWARIPIGGRNPDKLVDLVDLINETLDSRYHGTARGGSWTAYNIWTPENTELQVGWIDETDNFEDSWGMVPCGIYIN